MLIVRAAKDWFLLVDQHWKVTLPCFFGGAIIYLCVAAFWPKVYTGTAIVELNPSANWQSDTVSQRAIEAEAIRQATTMPAWAGIVKRLDLSPETVADGRLFDAAESLASQVSIEQIDDAKHVGPVLRVSYAAPNREHALKVTEAVADNLANPPSAAPFEPASTPKLADPPPGQVAPLGSSLTRKTEPPASFKVNSSASERPAAHQIRALRPPTRTPATELARRLQARVEEGAKLAAALSENSATLNGLRQQLAQADQKTAAMPPIAKSVPPPSERKVIAPRVNPQIQNLRQELARDQQALDDLRKRYTEDYPDVVAAKDKVQDLQVDISRLEAIDSRSAQVEPPPQASAPPTATRDESARNQIVQRLNNAQSSHEELQKALERNHDQVAHLQSEIASSKSVDAAIAAGSKDPNPTAPAQPAALPAMPSAGAANSAAANPESADLLPATPTPVNPAAKFPSTAVSGSALPGSLLSLAEDPKVVVSPAYFAAPLSWLFSIIFGTLTAFAAAWLAERRDPSIRSERTLRHLLPNSAAFLGGIPRVRHEVIPE